MSNIHRINDIENNYNSNNTMNRWQQRQQDINRLRVPFISQNSSAPKNPLKETFWDMLKITFCPNLNFASFTVIIVILHTVIFLYCCLRGIAQEGSFLQVQDQVLFDNGANQPIIVYEKMQYWRWITACLLHADFMHLFFNSLSILIFCSQIEQGCGWFSTLWIYLLAGFGGNMFSSLVSIYPDAIYVGASTCIFGILGALLSYFILNWNALRVLEEQRCMLMCFSFILVMFIFVSSLSSNNPSVDHSGHFGGFISGFFLGLAIPDPLVKKEYEKNCKIVGIVLYSLFLILGFSLFTYAKFSK